MIESPQEQLKQTRKLMLISAICVILFVVWSQGQTNKTAKDIENQSQQVAKNAEKNNIPVIKDVERFETVEKSVENRSKMQNKITKLENNDISLEINKNGMKIDYAVLKKYFTEHTTNPVHLLSPSDAPNYEYVDFGWFSEDKNAQLPNKSTLWNEVSKTKSEAVFQTVINGNKFTISVNMDEQYKYILNISMKSSVKNAIPYVRIRQDIEGKKSAGANVHEGVVLLKNNLFDEVGYSSIKKEEDFSAKKTWIGLTDKYWLKSIIAKTKITNNTISYEKTKDCEKCYQIAMFPSESSDEYIFDLYLGAKELNEIEKYKNNNKIELFDRSIDFGWFYFITKPILILIKHIYNFCGNFGVAIILLTILIRILLFPLAHKSYKSMAKIKTVTPKMQALKEKYKDDKKALNLAIVELYKTEKVNPAAGCLPLLLQIPVFFALYKVLSVSIEMRDAHFIFWLKDLSDPDPTSIFNLFGLLPFSVPQFLQIGVLPIFMGVTMYIQQKFSPAPSDPNQAKMMKLLPIIFTFMFASFPSGLVLYWSVNNILSILQQYIVEKSIKKVAV